MPPPRINLASLLHGAWLECVIIAVMTEPRPKPLNSN
jgi:hypothetical protein